jgi:O-antigen ligase
MVTIQTGYAVSNIALGLLILATLFTVKKAHIKLEFPLLLPVLMYALMLLSLIWSIDSGGTIKALGKEIALFLIPICFMLFQSLSAEQRQKLIKYYCYGILVFCVFYYIRALVRYNTTGDSSVFFYHELVTKDVHAVHVSVYVAIAFFWFFTHASKSYFSIIASGFLLITIFLLSSKNIIAVIIVLIGIYLAFYWKYSKRFRMKNLILFLLLLTPIFFAGKIKQRFLIEYQTVADENTLNTENKLSGAVYNKSIREAWTNDTFTASDYFPGTAFRVYQFRIFTEMLQEDPIFLTGYGLDASKSKIMEKSTEHGLHPGYGTYNFHNQYVQNFADLGIFGLLLLILMLFINLKNAFKTKDFAHIAFAILMISLFLTESFLWRQRGVMFFSLFYCLFNARHDIASYNTKTSI